MKTVVVLSMVGLLLPIGAAFAQEDELYKTKNCFACHRVERDYHGPSFKNIAARYADDKGADLKLARKVREGGAGVWGPSPMPPQTQVTEAETLTLVRWILEQK